MENKLLSATVLPPLLRLPPEIRLQIYRLLLLSKAPIRMRFPNYKNDNCAPNGLLPAILSTCHLIYGEAMDVLYKENVFWVHRVEDSNSNSALISRAESIIGVFGCGEMDALSLVRFLHIHPNLKFLRLVFRDGYLENTVALKVVSEALVGSRYSSAFSVCSNDESPESSFNKEQLVQSVAQNALRNSLCSEAEGTGEASNPFTRNLLQKIFKSKQTESSSDF